MPDIIWGTRSRTGSQFLLQLTVKLLGNKTQPQSRVSGARREGMAKDLDPSLDDFRAKGDLIGYFKHHNFRAAKIEEPSNDELGQQLADAFPETRWLASYRPIESVLRSHYNIKKWGHGEDYVLDSFRNNIALYERLDDEGRLFMVDVERRQHFSPERFCEYLGVEATTRFTQAVESWEPLNDLAYQKDKWGEDWDGSADDPPGLQDLHERHDWVGDVTARYSALIDRHRS